MARIQLRRDTAANWTSVNPILASGEQGYETDTGLMKVGNGLKAWADLNYFGAHDHNGGGGGTGGTNLGVTNVTQTTLDVTSDTGTDATLVAATALKAGLMSAQDKADLEVLKSGSGGTDNDTTYTLATGVNVENNHLALALTGSDSSSSIIEITPGSGISISDVTTTGFTISAVADGSGGGTVTPSVNTAQVLLAALDVAALQRFDVPNIEDFTHQNDVNILLLDLFRDVKTIVEEGVIKNNQQDLDIEQLQADKLDKTGGTINGNLIVKDSLNVQGLSNFDGPVAIKNTVLANAGSLGIVNNGAIGAFIGTNPEDIVTKALLDTRLDQIDQEFDVDLSGKVDVATPMMTGNVQIVKDGGAYITIRSDNDIYGKIDASEANGLTLTSMGGDYIILKNGNLVINYKTALVKAVNDTPLRYVPEGVTGKIFVSDDNDIPNKLYVDEKINDVLDDLDEAADVVYETEDDARADGLFEGDVYFNNGFDKKVIVGGAQIPNRKSEADANDLEVYYDMQQTRVTVKGVIPSDMRRMDALPTP